MPKKECKIKTLDKVTKYLDDFKEILICEIKDLPADMVHKARKLLRDQKSEMVCGKSTVMIKAIKNYLETKKKLPGFHTKEGLEQVIKDIPGKQISLIFTNADVSKITEITSKFIIEKQAKSGAISPIEVTLQPGPTGMDASQIEYFQILKIPTKVVKNQLEIMSATKILAVGQKISMSEINLMKKFNIRPYKHFIQVKKIYMNGKMYGEEIMKINDVYLAEKLNKGISNVAALAMRLNIPCKASAAHIVANAFKNLCGLGAATGITFKQAACFTAGPSAPVEVKKEEKKVEKKVVEKPKVEEVVEEDFGVGDMFG